MLRFLLGRDLTAALINFLNEWAQVARNNNRLFQARNPNPFSGMAQDSEFDDEDHPFRDSMGAPPWANSTPKLTPEQARTLGQRLSKYMPAIRHPLGIPLPDEIRALLKEWNIPEMEDEPYNIRVYPDGNVGIIKTRSAMSDITEMFRRAMSGLNNDDPNSAQIFDVYIDNKLASMSIEQRRKILSHTQALNILQRENEVSLPDELKSILVNEMGLQQFAQDGWTVVLDGGLDLQFYSPEFNEEVNDEHVAQVQPEGASAVTDEPVI